MEEPQDGVALTTPLQFNVQVGNPRVELRLVMSAAAYAIADPCRQHLAAGDALSGQFVGRWVLGLADTGVSPERLTYLNGRTDWGLFGAGLVTLQCARLRIRAAVLLRVVHIYPRVSAKSAVFLFFVWLRRRVLSGSGDLRSWRVARS